MTDQQNEPGVSEPATPVAPTEDPQADRDPKAGFMTKGILEGGPNHEINTESE